MMTDSDPLETQRNTELTVEHDLNSAGFTDVHEIGRGGFGIVYRCTQTSLDRTVAIKVLTRELDATGMERFAREQRAMGRLSMHPNVVTILEVGTTDSAHPYIVMQFFPGGSLDSKIRREGPVRIADVLDLGIKISDALDAAHRIEIIHRDVKPANILLDAVGEPALADFGIAHISGGFETETGTVTGSPAFAAPEVLNGEEPTTASDVYGLGATLFAALTGHVAFQRRRDESIVTQFLRVTSRPFPNLREKGVPDDLSQTLERAMSVDPSSRPSVAQLSREIREIQARTNKTGSHSNRSQPESVNESSKADPVARKSEARIDGNLPSELSEFVGRRHELARAKGLLTKSRLVSIVGMGGVGKTRLAVRLASSVQRGYPDGAWIVELGDLHDEAMLTAVVSDTLRVREHPPTPLVETLTEFLSKQKILLLLDNCEQMIDEVADLSHTILKFCPNIQILITSREPTNVPGELVLRLDPFTVQGLNSPSPSSDMSQYDAVSLFAARASAAFPSFELTPTNTQAVAGICRKVDGIPLLIELAAARLTVLSPDQILEHLTDRYALLTRGSRSAPSRQQTLQACVDWSYQLCTDTEQKMWSDASVFAGSFELDSAEYVCGETDDAGQVLDTLTSLVDKSILSREQFGESVQFRLLDSLREYGRAKSMEGGTSDQLRRRHRDFYLRLALNADQDWFSGRQIQWIDRFDREQTNLREAMKFCLTDSEIPDAGLKIAAPLYLLWGTRGYFSECRSWLDKFLARSDSLASATGINALYSSCVLALLQGDLQAADEAVRQGHAVAVQTADTMSDAVATHMDGLLCLFRGDTKNACVRLENALHTLRTGGNLWLQAESLTFLGLAFELEDKNLERAAPYYGKSISLSEANEESVFLSYTLWATALAYWRRGDCEQSRDLLNRSLGLVRVIDDPVSAANSLDLLAWISARTGEFNRAGTLLGAAEKLGRAVGAPQVFMPGILDFHNSCIREVKNALGDEGFTKAKEEGCSFDLESSIAFARGARNHVKRSDSDGLETLTKREREVSDLIADGLTNKEIAGRLFVSQRTVEGHVEHTLAKLGFGSRVQIAAWIIERRQQA